MDQLTVTCYLSRRRAIANGSAKFGKFEFAIAPDMLAALTEAAKQLLASEYATPDEEHPLEVSGTDWTDVRPALEERAQQRLDEQSKLAERFRAAHQGGVLELSLPLSQMQPTPAAIELLELPLSADLEEFAKPLVDELCQQIVNDWRALVSRRDAALPDPEHCWDPTGSPIPQLADLVELRRNKRRREDKDELVVFDAPIELTRTEAALRWRADEQDRRLKEAEERQRQEALDRENRLMAAINRVVSQFGTDDERRRHANKGLAPDEIMTIAFTHLFPSLGSTAESYKPILDSECDCRHYPVYKKVKLRRQPLENEAAALKRVREGIDRDANRNQSIDMAFSARVELMEQSCHCHGSHEGDTRARRVYLGITIMVDELDLMSRDFTARAAPGEA